jgi:hypothetical protein
VPSPEINAMTQREWRELGFFYDRDDVVKEWRLIGSKAGLRQFANALQEYAADARNEVISEHEHFSPYGYLKLGTSATPEITKDWITGPLSEIHQLSLTVSARLDVVSAGESIFLRTTFAPLALYEFVLEVQGDSFDPAKADPACW